jgi:D-3-phosphoglycerate dehydrogenase
MAKIIQTDIAWPDDSIERAVIEAAGHELVTGSSDLDSAEAVEAFVAAHDPQAIMTCWALVSARAIAAPADLRVVQRVGVGLDNIAVEAATRRGAWVTNVPDYCVGEVSAHAIALLLCWARGVVGFDRDMKEGAWDPSVAQLRRVSDLTVGIIGFGRIGRATSQALHGLGCRVLTSRRRAVGGEANTSLEALLEASDVVILHAPLTTETQHLINADRIARMKRGAFLINVSRGPLVDNDALLEALRSGQLSGAGLDVIEGEPSPPRALVERPEVIVTPHIAFSSDASLAELRRRSAEEVVRVLDGAAPLNPCNHSELKS